MIVTLPPILFPVAHGPVAPIRDCAWLPWIDRLPSISLPQNWFGGPAAWSMIWTLPWTIVGSPAESGPNETGPPPRSWTLPTTVEPFVVSSAPRP